MNILEPSITHSPFSARAVVRVAPASEPASGSVRPKAARRSPEASCGSQCARCALVAEEQDRHRPERGVRGDRDRERGVDARELLDAERVGERVAARAAVGLGHGYAEQAERRRLAQLGQRKSAVRVQFLGHGSDDALGESPHRVTEQAMLVREIQVHALHDTGRVRCARVDDGSLARYADAIVRDGLLIGPGDVLAVHPEPIQRELTVALTEAGYRAGARYVDVLDGRPAHHARPRAAARRRTRSTGGPPGRTRACASSCARAPASSGSRAARIRRCWPTCRPRAPSAAWSTARGCRPTAARSGAPTRASSSWPGRRRPGPRRSTPS